MDIAKKSVDHTMIWQKQLKKEINGEEKGIWHFGALLKFSLQYKYFCVSSARSIFTLFAGEGRVP